MGRLRLFGELIEAGGAVEGSGGSGGGGGGGHQIARVVRASGDYQTTSQSFVDIDTNNLVINLTTGDSWVLLLLAGSAYLGSGIQYACFDFTIDGARQGQAKGVQYVQPCYMHDVQIVWLAQVTAGSHTFRPQWRGTGSPCCLRANSTDSPLLFAVVEFK
jgi:hypothetical protein